MSVQDIDVAARGRRMKDYMRAEDINDDACVKLVAEVLRMAAEDYIQASRDVLRNPRDREAQEYRDSIRRFYRSDLFAAFSGVVVDSETVIQALDKQARLGTRPREEAIARAIRLPD